MHDAKRVRVFHPVCVLGKAAARVSEHGPHPCEQD